MTENLKIGYNRLRSITANTLVSALSRYLNLRPVGGGANQPAPAYSSLVASVALKRLLVGSPNFLYLSGRHFYAFWTNEIL